MKGWLAIALGAVMMICAAVGATGQTVQATVDRIILELKLSPSPESTPTPSPTALPSPVLTASPWPRSTSTPTPLPTRTGPRQSEPFCPSSCKDGMTNVYQPTAQGCQLHFTIPCYPGACSKDGKVCGNVCATSNDCAQGTTCSSVGRCVVSTSVCRDATTVQSSNDTLTSCLPYSCLAGQCRTTCQSNADCAGGATCNKTTQRCVGGK